MFASVRCGSTGDRLSSCAKLIISRGASDVRKVEQGAKKMQTSALPSEYFKMAPIPKSSSGDPGQEVRKPQPPQAAASKSPQERVKSAKRIEKAHNNSHQTGSSPQRSVQWRRTNFADDPAAKPFLNGNSLPRILGQASGGRPGKAVKSGNSSDVPASLSLPVSVNGRSVKFEAGRLARLAEGSVVATSGGNSVLAAVAVSREGGMEFQDAGTNLQLDYREKAASRGMIPINARKRESSASDKETLVGRLIDRSLRPLFPKGITDQIQLSCTLMSADSVSNADALSINAASTALLLSHVEWKGPVGAVRLGMVDGEFVENPSIEQLRDSTLNMLVAGTKGHILALEAEAAEIDERTLFEGLERAQEKIGSVIEAQLELAKNYQKSEKIEPQEISDPCPLNEAGDLFAVQAVQDFRDVFRSTRSLGKQNRAKLIGRAFGRTLNRLKKIAADHFSQVQLNAKIDSFARQAFRELIVETKTRCDGRALDDIRSIRAEVGLLGGDVHGSALFERGDTQVLAVTTLGLPQEAQKVEQYLAPQEKIKRFLLHYDFPSFCNGEVGTRLKANRREIGHGALAEKSLAWMVPTEEDVLDPFEIFSGNSLIGKRPSDTPFRHVVRVNADVLGSDGSSSMATVCAGSMALMHAGVPLAKHVAGISVGLVAPETHSDFSKTNPIFLTDILGIEDHYGDMDFKVAGTANGITALQLDVKLPSGLPLNWASIALEKARIARVQLLKIMSECIPEPAKTLSPAAPVISESKVEPLLRPLLVRNGGEMINRIYEGTGARLFISEVGDLEIHAPNSEACRTARKLVHELIGEVEVGSVYEGKVVRVAEFGVFLEVMPGRHGLLHISEIVPGDQRPTSEIESMLPKLNDKIFVTVIEYDKKRGQIKLTKHKNK